MKSNKLLVAVTLIAVTLYLVGLVVGLRWWIATLVAAGGLGVAWIAWIAARRRRATPDRVPDAMALPVLVAPGPPGSERTGPVTLRSSRRDAPFRFTAKVHWGATFGDGAAARERALDSIISRARAVAATFEPGEHELLAAELSVVLGESPRRDGNEVEAWATEVMVLLAESDERHLAKVSELRRYSELWDLSTEHERKVRAYLQSDALATPANAVVWWLSRDPRQVEQCADLVGVLGQVSDAASGRSDTASGDAALLDAMLSEDADTASPAMVDRLLDRFDDSQRRYVARRLADLFEEAGDAGLAADIRSRNDVDRIDETAVRSERESVPASLNGLPDATNLLRHSADEEAAPTR